MLPDRIFLQNRQQQTIALSTTAATSTGTLVHGCYDVWADVDFYIRVAPAGAVSPSRAQDVTTSNGYLIKAGNVVPVDVKDGDTIGVIAGATGNFHFHQTA